MTEMCNQVKNAIALEGKAPENEEFQKHLSKCTGCARFLRNLLAVESELGALVTHDASDDIVEKLLARPELSAKASSRRTLHWAMGLAAAATIAFVAARVTFMGYSSFSREYEIDPHVDVKTSQSEGDELSSEEQERLDSLGDVGGYDYADVADDQLAGNVTTRDEVIHRKEQVENQAKLRARIRELNERGYSRPIEDDAELENKNGSLKKDNEAGGGFASGWAVSGDRLATTPAAAEPVLGDARAQDRASRTAGRSPASPRAQAPPSSSIDESEMVANEPAPSGNRSDGDFLRSRNESVMSESKGKESGSGGRFAAAASPSATVEETVTVGGESPVFDVRKGLANSGELVEFDKLETDGDKSRVIAPRQEGAHGYFQRVAEPRKLVHVDAVYPEAFEQKRASGTVVLRALIDRDGNVTRAIVLESVEALDQAAIDAVLQWKYEASDRDQRTVTVRIEFEAAPPNRRRRSVVSRRARAD